MQEKVKKLLSRLEEVERKLDEATELMSEIKEMLQQQNSPLIPSTNIPNNIA